MVQNDAQFGNETFGCLRFMTTYNMFKVSFEKHYFIGQKKINVQ